MRLPCVPAERVRRSRPGDWPRSGRCRAGQAERGRTPRLPDSVPGSGDQRTRTRAATGKGAWESAAHSGEPSARRRHPRSREIRGPDGWFGMSIAPAPPVLPSGRPPSAEAGPPAERPSRVVPLVRICAEAAREGRPYRDPWPRLLCRTRGERVAPDQQRRTDDLQMEVAIERITGPRLTDEGSRRARPSESRRHPPPATRSPKAARGVVHPRAPPRPSSLPPPPATAIVLRPQRPGRAPG